VYPEPPGIDEEITRQKRGGRKRQGRMSYQRGNLYRAYVNWYGKVRAEA
jgi:hypothetical protein